MAEQLGQGGARFLMAVIDGGGTVPPAMGLASELVRRGHVVRVLADPTIEASARSAGCAFSQWRDAPHVDSRAEQTTLIAPAYRPPLCLRRPTRGRHRARP